MNWKTKFTDNIIRIGDRVKRIRGDHNGMKVGDTDIVLSEREGVIHLQTYSLGHTKSNFIKVLE